MKKVGIITFHYYYNYGSRLQAYALQEAIRREGCLVEIINFSKPDVPATLSLRLKRIPYYITHLKKIINVLRFKEIVKSNIKPFDSFTKKYLKITNCEYHTIEDFKGEICYCYDIYMTGSDQTFSPKLGINPCLCLDFVSIDKKRVAYAPSIGTLDFNIVNSNQLKKFASKYQFLSCREKQGSIYLHNFTKKNVPTVLDPTLLLNDSDWSVLTSHRIVNEPYILCYFLGHRKHYEKQVKHLQNQTDLKVVYVPIDYHDYKKDNNHLFDCGPQEWLSLIKYANIVCTDSFHGICFCINFKKDFYAFTKVRGGINSGDNSRIFDILDRMSLTNRYVAEDILLDYTSIDYTDTYKRLEKERVFSKAFLKSIVE